MNILKSLATILNAASSSRAFEYINLSKLITTPPLIPLKTAAQLLNSARQLGLLFLEF